MYLRTMFNFYDYDNNGNLGSVDIINLKKHFDHFYLESILKEFTDVRIYREMQKNFKKAINLNVFGQKQAHKPPKSRTMATLTLKKERQP